MDERQRLLALLERDDRAIEELYVLGVPGAGDLSLRLEGRWEQAARQLTGLEGKTRPHVWQSRAQETSAASSPTAG